MTIPNVETGLYWCAAQNFCPEFDVAMPSEFINEFGEQNAWITAIT